MSWDMFDHLPVGATVWECPSDDPLDITLRYANHQAVIESGYPISSRVGATVRDMFPSAVGIPDEINTVKKTLMTASDGVPRAVRNMPYGEPHIGHPEKVFDVHLSRIGDRLVLLVYVLKATGSDIQLVREVETKLLMLQHLPGYAIFTEFDGTILEVNKLHPDYAKAHTFVGSNLFESSTPVANVAMRNAVRALVEEGLAEFSYVSEGSPPGHTYSTTVKRVKLPGNGVVLLWSAWDITYQTHTMDKLKLANDDLEQFAYIVSHDLQEPIRTIATYVEILMEDFPELFGSGDPHEFMKFIRDSALRQQLLIRDVLTYSRTSGMDFEDCSVRVVFDEVCESLKGLIHLRNAIVDWEGTSDVHVFASPTHLAQALQNLITNAIKYTDESLVPFVRVRVDQESNYWRIHIRDNGLGIEPEYAEQVFKMFKRLHPEASAEGTGIGLPIVRRIARKHGGDCWFDSKPGKGSTFHFSIRKPINLVP